MQRRTDAWRKQHGVCVVCGQPLASPQYNQALDGRILMVGQEDAAVFSAAMDSDGRLLTEECPVRMALARFNALGNYQAAHIVDDYTLMEDGRRASSLRADFKKYQDVLVAAHPKAMTLFSSQVLGKQPEALRLYDEGATLGKRIITDLTVGACGRCNMAMNRPQAHATAVYRCFAVTRDSNVPALEGTQASATTVKKVLQQVALFYQLDEASWRVKTEKRMLLNATAWRCIAHLAEWGVAPMGGGSRQRMVALFHASYYVYLSSMSSVSRMDFATWHTHVWRDFYMARHPSSTFLGMHQAEVARFVDFTRKDGARWEEFLSARLSGLVDELEAHMALHSEALVNRTLEWGEAMTKEAVVDEMGLFRFFTTRSRSLSTKSALDRHLWAFFRYNLSGGASAPFLLHQCTLLAKEVARVLASRPTARGSGAWFANEPHGIKSDEATV